jgi:S-adenosylmethionine-diacylgycerolhomoserine-N-methlytransferase
VSAAAIGAGERMNRIYRTQRLVYDATRRPYLLGREALVRSLAPPPGGHVLEIGCGTAWNLLSAADCHPDACLYGLDISSAMLQTARRSIARRGLGARIVVVEADATGFDAQALFGRPAFDRVFFSYALSMIPDWRRAVACAMDAVADRGSLHIVDFGQCERLPRPVKTALFAWLARFSVAPPVDLEPELCRLAQSRGFIARIGRLYGGYAVEALMARPPDMS